MSRSRFLVVVVTLVAVSAGCKKSDSGSNAAPVVPDDSSNGPPELRGKEQPDEAGKTAGAAKDVALDLSRHGVRGEITVPEGTEVNSPDSSGRSPRNQQH